MPEETNPVWDKVDEFRKSLKEIERKAIECTWQYWLENSSLITKKKLAYELKSNSALDAILEMKPSIVQLIDRDPCNSMAREYQVVLPTLLGVLCLDNRCGIHACIRLLIEAASIAYSPDNASNVLNSEFLWSKYGPRDYSSFTVVLMQYSAQLLPLWSMAFGPDESWRVWFPDNVSDVAFGHVSPEQYLEGAIEESLKIHDPVELPGLLLNDVIYRHFSAADSLLQQYAREDLISLMNTVVNNLGFESKEHWANAVGSMRRVFQVLADQLFPPGKSDRVRRNGKPISVGPKDYINRLICYVEDHSGSSRFIAMTSSNLAYLGTRLDAVYDTFNKGAHSEVFTRDEAEMYIIYGYLLVRDILSLVEEAESSKRIT